MLKIHLKCVFSLQFINFGLIFDFVSLLSRCKIFLQFIMAEAIVFNKAIQKSVYYAIVVLIISLQKGFQVQTFQKLL